MYLEVVENPNINGEERFQETPDSKNIRDIIFKGINDFTQKDIEILKQEKLKKISDSKYIITKLDIDREYKITVQDKNKINKDDFEKLIKALKNVNMENIALDQLVEEGRIRKDEICQLSYFKFKKSNSDIKINIIDSYNDIYYYIRTDIFRKNKYSII